MPIIAAVVSERLLTFALLNLNFFVGYATSEKLVLCWSFSVLNRQGLEVWKISIYRETFVHVTLGEDVVVLIAEYEEAAAMLSI